MDTQSAGRLRGRDAIRLQADEILDALKVSEPVGGVLCVGREFGDLLFSVFCNIFSDLRFFNMRMTQPHKGSVAAIHV